MKRIKSIFNCLSAYQLNFLLKLFRVFIIIVLILICQIFGLIEIIPTIYAITPSEESIDEPIPLESLEEDEALNSREDESNLYEEIPEDSDSEITNVLPGWRNKNTAEVRGLLVGVLIGLATALYLLVISPDSGFSCPAYRNTVSLVSSFLDKFR